MNEVSVGYKPVIEEICSFCWNDIGADEMAAVARAYYYFSIQFRESLEVAIRLHPSDKQLQQLVTGECATDNLSPWPDVAHAGERLNHDEFMRRALTLTPIDEHRQRVIDAAGEDYLARTRALDDVTRAMSIASYEDGGLEAVFTAMLRGKYWNTPLLGAFRHFLQGHIAFDADPDAGHGALARHLCPDQRVRVLWIEFRDLLLTATPHLMPATWPSDGVLRRAGSGPSSFV